MTTDRNFNSNFSGKRLYSKKSYNSLKTDKYLSISQSTNQRLPHILVPCSLYKVFFSLLCQAGERWSLKMCLKFCSSLKKINSKMAILGDWNLF